MQRGQKMCLELTSEIRKNIRPVPKTAHLKITKSVILSISDINRGGTVCRA